MPLTDKPTSVIGYDVFHAKRKKSQLAFNSTVDRGFTRYWHTSIQQDEMQEIATQLQQVVVKSLEAFKTHNNVYPKQLVIFRDGVGDSQK